MISIPRIASRSARLACILVPFFGAFAASADDELIQVRDLLQLRQLQGVSVSPDGGRVVYEVKSIVADSDGEQAYRTHLWLAPLDGSAAPRQLTHGERDAQGAVWHPDGRSLAFVRKAGEEGQIFLLSLDGGEARQLTRAEHGAAAPRFSADGRWLLFASDLPAGELGEEMPEGWPHERPGRKVESLEEVEADPDGDMRQIRRWLADNAAGDDPKVLTRLDLQGERRLAPRLDFEHLFVLDLAADGEAEARRISRGPFDHGGGRWAVGAGAEAARVLAAGSLDASQHPDRVEDSDILALSTDGSGARVLIDLPGYGLQDPLPSPNGQHIAFLAQGLEDRGYRLTRIGVAGADGSSPRLLTEALDRSVRAMRWSRDGRWLYFTAASDGGFPLYRVSAEGGSVETLTSSEEGVRSFDLSGDAVALVLTRVSNPFELYRTALDGSGERPLSRHNSGWLAGKTLSFPEARQLERDGLTIDYWLMKPTRVEAGKRYPLLLEIHGGPQSMWGPGEATMWHEFQLLAARGFGIVYSNPRGSGGYGRAFRKANYRDWGDGPGGDALAAASEAAEEPWVDKDRQVVTGGSYAGYLTAWIVGHDHRFKAAVAQRGVYDLATFFGEGNAWRLVPRHFGGYPWEEEARAALDYDSPLTYVEEIRTPLLILHADQDLRTGVSQSEWLYKSLKVLERPVEYVRYPNAGHDLSRTGDPKQRADRLLRILEFMARFVELGGK